MTDRRGSRRRKPGAAVPLRPRRADAVPPREEPPPDRVVLYSHPFSNYGAKVAIVLRHKAVPYEERRPPGGLGSPAYRSIVRTGTIPAIVHGELVLSESETINEYLEEAFPEPPMLPGDAALRARQRLLARFHDLAVEPPVRALFRQVDPQRRERAVIEERVAELHQRLEQLEAMADPQPFLATPRLGLADCGYAPTLMLAEMVLEALGHRLRLGPKLAAWRERLEAEPAVAEVLAATREAGQTWLEARLETV
jgi:glutathione S-transferase